MIAKYCPSCHATFPMDMTHCRSCKRMGSINSAKKIHIELWTVEALPDGRYLYRRPEHLNPAAVRRLARTQGGSGDAA